MYPLFFSRISYIIGKHICHVHHNSFMSYILGNMNINRFSELTRKKPSRRTIIVWPFVPVYSFRIRKVLKALMSLDSPPRAIPNSSPLSSIISFHLPALINLSLSELSYIRSENPELLLGFWSTDGTLNRLTSPFYYQTGLLISSLKQKGGELSYTLRCESDAHVRMNSWCCNS